MLRKFTLLLLPTFIGYGANAQSNIKTYVQQHAVQVFTDKPDTAYDADLEKFGEAIGNKRIVMLGEQSHGDAASFLFKSRLIKYLHEKKGFNVLAFESDFVALTGGWDNIEKTKQGIDSFAKANIFPIWTYCFTTDYLLHNYLLQTQKSKTPLQLAGFDCQLHGRYALKHLKENLQATLNKLSYITTIKDKADLLLAVADSLFLQRQLKDKERYGIIAEAVSAILSADADHKELSSWDKILLENLVAGAKNLQYYNPSKRINHYYRDKQMAKNIEWLATQKYPNEKIIIWAHNGHIAKSSGYDYEQAKETKYMMGDFLFKETAVANELYIAGITSYSGTVNWANDPAGTNMTLEKPGSKAMESWIPDEYDFAFIDFAAYNAQVAGKPEAFSMKGSVVNAGKFHRSYVHYWTQLFDAVFFIRNMYGCKPLQ